MGLVASPSRRLVAGVLDAAIVDAAARGLRRIQGSRWDDSALSAKWKRLGVAGCYFVAATAVAGRTGGQAILGLRVVDEFTRRKPGWRAAMIRWVVRQPPDRPPCAGLWSSCENSSLMSMSCGASMDGVNVNSSSH